MKRLAIYNGHETTAQKINGQWFVGGDKVQKGDNVLIAAKEFVSGRWAWHVLKGCRLKFDDFMTEQEIQKQVSSC